MLSASSGLNGDLSNFDSCLRVLSTVAMFYYRIVIHYACSISSVLPFVSARLSKTSVSLWISWSTFSFSQFFAWVTISCSFEYCTRIMSIYFFAKRVLYRSLSTLIFSSCRSSDFCCLEDFSTWERRLVKSAISTREHTKSTRSSDSIFFCLVVHSRRLIAASLTDYTSFSGASF